jgi:hypothetical protein
MEKQKVGHIISASCKCGYAAPELPIGGARGDFTTNSAHPALCQTGKHIVTINLKASEIVCPTGCSGTPLPYTSKLQIIPGNEEISDWLGGHALNDGAYLCPSCNEYSLKFAFLWIFFD